MAKTNPAPTPDPEDMFADTRMSFGDHIEDLRTHLFRAIYGFIAAVVICVLPPVGPFALKFITKPVEDQLQNFYDRYYARRYAEIAQSEAGKIPPIRLMMRVHQPTLKDIYDGKRIMPPVLENLVPGFEKLLQTQELFAQPVEEVREDWHLLPVEIPDPIALAKRMSELGRLVRPERLASFRIEEVFIVYIKVGLLVGFVVASPWVFFQIWSFIAAGLYPHEKRLVNVYLPVSLGLFLAGFFICEFFALPKAIEALLWFNDWLGFEPELRLNDWLGFAILMPLVFGLSFQTPLVMLFLFKLGIFGIETYAGSRGLCYFVMAVFAAVITPSTDAPTMMMLWVPMCLLFEVGIILCKLQPAPLEEELDESDLDPMVGV